jgi:hypothetical protein
VPVIIRAKDLRRGLSSASERRFLHRLGAISSDLILTKGDPEGIVVS